MTLTTGELTIRPMAAADIEWAMQLADSIPEAPHWPLRAYRTAVAPGTAPKRMALLIESASENPGLENPALEDCRLGFCVASLLPPVAELETVVVLPAARRRGIGRWLMVALGAGLKRNGVTEVILEVRASNRTALALYGSLGFQEIGRRVRYYADPTEDAILMRWPLG